MNTRNVFEWSRAGQISLISLACLILLILAYFFDYSGIALRTKGAVAQEAILKQQLQDTLTQEAALKNDVLHYPELKKMLVVWQNKLVSAKDIPEALNQLVKIGGANQLQFTSFTPKPKQQEDKYYKIPINLVVTGTYHEIAGFISQVVNMPWIIAFKQFSFKQIEQATLSEKGELPLVGEFLVEIYYLEST